MKYFTTLILILYSFISFSQISVFNQDGSFVAPFDTLDNIQPVVTTDAVPGYLFWFDAALMDTVTGIPAIYFHAPLSSTGVVDFSVIGRVLEIDKQICFLFVRGTDYNLVSSYWGDSIPLFVAAHTPPEYDCAMVPDWEYVPGWPARFYYDEPLAESLGEGWTVVLDDDSPVMSAPGYFYKTPRSDGYPFYTSYGPFLKVSWRWPTGQDCHFETQIRIETYMPAIAKPGDIIVGIDGRLYKYETAPAGVYIFKGQKIAK